MATRALLLSGDEQTVQAVTQVLEQLDFAFEHSSERPLSTDLLAHHHFDVILLDCDNTESATAVFNCLRGSTLNSTSVTIAIVNGQAGVPNAFRLGAGLVLTKPVSLEQAKGTLRRALGALRKEVRAGKAAPVSAAAAPVRNADPAAIVSRAISHKEAQTAHAAKPPVSPPQLQPSDAVDSSAGKAQGDLILAATKELESGHAALPPPSLRAAEKRRRNKATLLVAVALILVAVGLYAAGTTQPSFRNLVAYEYQAALRRVAEFRTKRQAIASTTPTQPRPYAARSVAAPSAVEQVEAADTAAPNSAANLASTSTTVAEAKASPQPTSLQNVSQDGGANSTASVPTFVPATPTTQEASSDTSTEPVVLPENVADARIMRRARPVYPKLAQQKKVHGAVVLQVVINKEGKVDSMQVINGNPLLRRAAMDTVRQRRYKPYFREGEAVPFETQVTVAFRLP